MSSTKLKTLALIVCLFIIVNQQLFSNSLLNFKFTEQKIKATLNSTILIKDQAKLKLRGDFEFDKETEIDNLNYSLSGSLSINEFSFIPIQLGCLESTATIRGIYEADLTLLNSKNSNKLTVTQTSFFPTTFLGLIAGPVRNNYLFFNFPNDNSNFLFYGVSHILKQKKSYLEASIAYLETTKIIDSSYLLKFAHIPISKALYAYAKWSENYLIGNYNLNLRFINRLILDKRATFNYSNLLYLSFERKDLIVTYLQSYLNPYLGLIKENKEEKPVENRQFSISYQLSKIKSSLSVETKLFEKEIYASMGQKKSFKIENMTQFTLNKIELSFGLSYQNKLSSLLKKSEVFNLMFLAKTTVKDLKTFVEIKTYHFPNFYLNMRVGISSVIKNKLYYSFVISKNRTAVKATFQIEFNRANDKFNLTFNNLESYTVNYSIYQ